VASGGGKQQRHRSEIISSINGVISGENISRRNDENRRRENLGSVMASKSGELTKAWRKMKINISL
jgi:hypothetical protein